MKKLLLTILSLSLGVGASLQAQTPEDLQSLAQQFEAPADAYKPQAWWHWLGSNFSKEGMTKDLAAMKEAGVNGVIVFNAPAWLDTAYNPWPAQTYRSELYWDALGHTLKEARRLNMTVGLHNSPGWSTTGGPWITPEKGMQRVAFSMVKFTGKQRIKTKMENPAEKFSNIKPEWFKDVAVFAVPDKKEITVADILDISANYQNGILTWDVPAGGSWYIYRFGYMPTMQLSHPTPEDVEKTAFEADKMDADATVFHWNNVLNPLKERFGEFIGTTFKIIWTDSYESWGQSWSPNFRADFIKMKGYDPAKQLILAYSRGEEIFDEKSFHLKDTAGLQYQETKAFVRDYAEVINRLYLKCFQIGRDMVNKAGFQFYWEPYGSIIDAPFDMEEGEGIADVPATEFWVHSVEPSGAERFAQAAAKYDKRIVAAEAFTGMEATCTFNETPAMLKFPADMAFSYGINQLFLHAWAHNPLSDEFQPGWNFVHYGTHFSRNQTWIKPAKAFFTYLARCQMLLQQGTFIARSKNVLHRSTPEAEIFFVRNTGESFEKQRFNFEIKNRKPELWNAYTGKITVPKFWNENGDVTLNLEHNESVFVIFPANETDYAKVSEKIVESKTAEEITGSWKVTFQPKTNEKIVTKTFNKLVDFSQQTDFAVKYFSGTAVYEKNISIKASDLKANKRIVLDLGKVYDMASLEINGKDAGVLWVPPYKMDITSFLQPGKNTLQIHVTNTWANRLIGDEQYPADFEWFRRENNGDPGMNGLPVMKHLPEWVTNGKPRPSKERKTFIPWSYFDKNSPLLPAGLLGPVSLDYEEIKTD